MYSNNASAGVVAIGFEALRSNTATGNVSTAIGFQSQRNTSSAAYNTSVGFGTLTIATTGSHNTALGSYAGYFMTTGSYNIALGSETLYSNSTGSDAVAIGYRAAYVGSNNLNSVSIGTEASFNLAQFSVAIGYKAARAGLNNGVVIGANAAQNAQHNTPIAIGPYALGNGTGSTFNNTAIGWAALLSANNASSSYNVAIGYESMRTLSGSQQSVAVGNSTLRNCTTGGYNAALGDNTLNSNTTGSYNAMFGFAAGFTQTTGSSNSGLGSEISTGNFSNSVILGRQATATGNNQFVVGSSSYNAGTVTVESLTSTQTWSVIINGTAYKILLA
jgi:hypothetical protein